VSSTFTKTLELLVDGGVELIVVGMASAIAQGAPLTTMDLDIVHRRTPENVDRLVKVLGAIDAVYRTDRRNIAPGREALLGTGHQLLRTRVGIVDCLGVMALGGVDLGYDELLQRSIVLRLDGREIRVLSLETYIEAKRGAGRPKDLAVLPTLEATLREIRARGG
jgi:hypothetical protein